MLVFECFFFSLFLFFLPKWLMRFHDLKTRFTPTDFLLQFEITNFDFSWWWGKFIERNNGFLVFSTPRVFHTPWPRNSAPRFPPTPHAKENHRTARWHLNGFLSHEIFLNSLLWSKGWLFTYKIYINGKSYIVIVFCILLVNYVDISQFHTVSIKGRSIIHSCNRCYRLQPLITALDMHVCQDANMCMIATRHLNLCINTCSSSTFIID